MKLVKQERFGDCGPACVATVAGCALELARWHCGATEAKGVTDAELVQALAALGVPALNSLTWPGLTVPAILTVPSLNYAGLLHFIVWDGKQILDPSNDGARYPDDGPVVKGKLLFPQWASVILILGGDAQ